MHQRYQVERPDRRTCRIAPTWQRLQMTTEHQAQPHRHPHTAPAHTACTATAHRTRPEHQPTPQQHAKRPPCHVQQVSCRPGQCRCWSSWRKMTGKRRRRGGQLHRAGMTITPIPDHSSSSSCSSSSSQRQATSQQPARSWYAWQRGHGRSGGVGGQLSTSARAEMTITWNSHGTWRGPSHGWRRGGGGGHLLAVCVLLHWSTVPVPRYR